ncbi:MAG: OadG family protein [Proteobacteria bacterium]|nr:OadG family protein [Pseudomonadota bacterium]
MLTDRTDALIESFWLLLVGMGGVFAALLLLATVFAALSALDRRLTRWRTRRAAELAAAANPAAHLGDREQPEDEEEEALIVVLAAAASVALQRRVTVRAVQLLGPSASNPWASAGRLTIMASRAINRRKG